MAFLQVQFQKKTVVSDNKIDLTVTSTGTNNLVVVGIFILSSTVTCSSVTDNKGNTYAFSTPREINTDTTYQAYGVQVTGSTTTIRASLSGSTSVQITAEEFSGGKITNATVYDVSSTGRVTSGTSISVTSFSPVADGNLIVATLTRVGADTWTAGANYTMEDATSVSNNSEYRLSSSGAETAPATYSAGGIASEIASSFNPLPSNQPARRMLMGVGK